MLPPLGAAEVAFASFGGSIGRRAEPGVWLLLHGRMDPPLLLRHVAAWTPAARIKGCGQLFSAAPLTEISYLATDRRHLKNLSTGNGASTGAERR